jgi:hypothetical protein
MGTSFVQYKGFGFWTRDSYLESWLTNMIEELCKSAYLEPWQEELGEHWRIQAKIDGGCMSVDLDKFLIDSKREKLLIEIAGWTLERCYPSGFRTGELFIDLLVGRLKTTVSSPIDYLD